MNRALPLGLSFAMLALAATAGAQEPAGAAGEQAKFGYMGVLPVPVHPALAAQLGLDDGRGVLVARVERDGPAEAGGLADNDVIVRIGEQIIFNVDQLQKLVNSLKPGTKVKVAVIRAGKEQTVEVALGGTAVRSWGRGVPMPFWGGGVEVDPQGRLRFRGPDGRELDVDVPLQDAKELWQQLQREMPDREEMLKELRKMKDQLPPQMWEQLQRMMGRPTTQPDDAEEKGAAPEPAPAEPQPAPAQPQRREIILRQQGRVQAGGNGKVEMKVQAGGAANMAVSTMSVSTTQSLYENLRDPA